MFSFKGFFTKDKNTHLEHLEDDIINRGAEGGENAINFLKSIILQEILQETMAVLLQIN